MTLLQEATLDRLWAKYEHRFGHPPPIGSADIDDAIAILRKESVVKNTDFQANCANFGVCVWWNNLQMRA